MKVREMRQLIHDKDDNDEIEFAAEGVVYFIGANIYIPEWKTLYLGLEDKDMNEALIQYEHERLSWKLWLGMRTARKPSWAGIRKPSAARCVLFRQPRRRFRSLTTRM
jgi:hypothetical protein